MLNEEVREKLLFKKQELKKDYEKKVGIIDVIFKLKNLEDNKRVFGAELNCAIDIIAFNPKNEFIRNDFKERLNEFLPTVLLDEEKLDVLVQYFNEHKISLKIARGSGVGSVNSIMLVTKQLINSLYKYLSSFEEYKSLKNCKYKIEKILSGLGFYMSIMDIHNIIKFYYFQDTEIVINYETLKKYRKENFEIVIEFAKRLKTLKKSNSNIIEVIKIEEQRLGLKDDKEKNNLNGEPNIERILKAKKFKIFKIKNDFEEKRNNKKNLDELRDRIEELEIQLFTIKDENRKLKDERKIFMQERLDNMEYSANQYKQAIEDFLNALNSEDYGLILNQLYLFNKGYLEEINMKAISTN